MHKKKSEKALHKQENVNNHIFRRYMLYKEKYQQNQKN